MQIDMNVLMNYTDWEREKWREWLGQHSESLKTSGGPHGDNRFQTVGDVVKHIFSAETLPLLSGFELSRHQPNFLDA